MWRGIKIVNNIFVLLVKNGFIYDNIYLNAKVSQLLLKCYFLLFEPNILLHDIVINKSNDLPSEQHENQTSETYDCRGQTNQSRLFYAFVNVHYVNVKPSIFDVIGRLSTTEYQKSSFFNVTSESLQ